MLTLASVRGGGRYATAHTTSMGTAAEQRFFDICRARGYTIRPANNFENRVNHFDFEVQGFKVEVKAMKAPRRGMAPDPDMIYVELKNVCGGSGWVYGNADFVAFEQRGGYLMVRRDELVQLVQSMQSKFRHSHVSGVYHTLYSRANRDDLVMVLHANDLARMKSKWLLKV